MYSLKSYPNPFNPSTNINYTIEENDYISISVYNLVGKEVQVLFDGYKEAGSHELFFNGLNYNSGIYIVRLTSSSFTLTEKIVLIK